MPHSMRVVYKYPLKIEDVFRLDVHLGARILLVAIHRGGPALWALADPDASMVTRDVVCLQSGHTILSRFLGSMEHAGSVILPGREPKTFELDDPVLHYFLEAESTVLEVEKKNARALRKARKDGDHG